MPEEKSEKECQSLLNKGRVSAWDLSDIVGLLSSLILAVSPAPPYYRALQRQKHSCLTITKSWDFQVTMDKEAWQIQFCINTLQTWNGRSILIPSTDLVTSFDAPGWLFLPFLCLRTLAYQLVSAQSSFLSYTNICLHPQWVSHNTADEQQGQPTTSFLESIRCADMSSGISEKTFSIRSALW